MMQSRMLESLIQSADEHPLKTALIGENETLTYKSLLMRALHAADALAQKKVSRLGLYRENSVEWVILDLAALIAEVTFVPIPSFFSDQQIRHLIHAADLDCILSEDVGRFMRLDAGMIYEEEMIENTSVLWTPSFKQRGESALKTAAKITFTSGTTGTPKGVCLSRTAIDSAAFSLAEVLLTLPIRSHINLLPFSTLLENIAGLYAPLLLGKVIHVHPGALLGFWGSSGLDIFCLIEKLNRFKPDSLILIPQMLTALVAVIHLQGPLKYFPAFMALGGAKTSPVLIRKARALGLPVYEGYGLSECGSVVSLNTPAHDCIGSVGKPLPHAEVKIEDGVIFVRGSSCSGYLGDTQGPPAWINTGDLGTWDEEGFLHITGRKKNVMVSAYGRNISPEWVESEFLKYPGFAQCIIFGDAQAFCTAIFVLRDHTITQETIAQWVQKLNIDLPDYAQVKRWILSKQPFSLANGLLTSNGRPRRDIIASHYQEEIATLYQDTVWRDNHAIL